MSRPSMRNLVFNALPGTSAEISKKSGVTRSTTNLWLRRLHDDGQCYISGYQPTGNTPAAIHTAGKGKDFEAPNKDDRKIGVRNYESENSLQHINAILTHLESVKKDTVRGICTAAKIDYQTATKYINHLLESGRLKRTQSRPYRMEINQEWAPRRKRGAQRDYLQTAFFGATGRAAA